MRTLLRRIILWALAGAPEAKSQSAELDAIAAEIKNG